MLGASYAYTSMPALVIATVVLLCQRNDTSAARRLIPRLSPVVDDAALSNTLFCPLPDNLEPDRSYRS